MAWLPVSRRGGAKRLVSQLSDPSRRHQAVSDLLSLGADAVPALVDALGAASPDIPPLAEGVLVRLGPQALPVLLKTLQEAHPQARAHAARILGRIKDLRSQPALLTALRGEYYTVRAAAALALGEIGGSGAFEPLVAARRDPEPSVRAAAALGLGFFPIPATVKALTPLLLEDPITEVRQAAARALGGIPDPETLPLLMEALHDSFWWYEREPAAADLLAAIQAQGEPAIDVLISALSDPEGAIRRFAVTLLGNMHADRAVKPLGMALYDLHHEVGSAAGLALGCIGPESLIVLEEAASHPEPDIRLNAALGMAGIDNPHAADLLLGLLDDPDRLVRRQAVLGLAAQQDPRAIAALLQLSGDRSDREMQALANEALKSLNLDS